MKLHIENVFGGCYCECCGHINDFSVTILDENSSILFEYSDSDHFASINYNAAWVWIAAKFGMSFEENGFKYLDSLKEYGLIDPTFKIDHYYSITTNYEYDENHPELCGYKTQVVNLHTAETSEFFTQEEFLLESFVRKKLEGLVEIDVVDVTQEEDYDSYYAYSDDSYYDSYDDSSDDENHPSDETQ